MIHVDMPARLAIIIVGGKIGNPLPALHRAAHETGTALATDQHLSRPGRLDLNSLSSELGGEEAQPPPRLPTFAWRIWLVPWRCLMDRQEANHG